MEPITITAARRPSRSRVNPSFSGSLPGYPDVDTDWLEDEGEDLPDHFPDPCFDPDGEAKESRSSVTLERGATLVFCPPSQAKNSSPKAVASAPPKVTSSLAKVTYVPRNVTSAPSAVTSAPPAVTSAPQAVTSAPSAVTSAPPTVTSASPTVTSAPPAVTSAAPAVTSEEEPLVTLRPKPVLVIPKAEAVPCKTPPPTSPKPVVTSPNKPPASPKPPVMSRTSSLLRSSFRKAPESREGQNGAKEGVKRITDKYATPGTLLRNVSVSSNHSQPPAATTSPKETLPCSPTPSITLTPSPSFSFPQPAGDKAQTPDTISISSTASTITATAPSERSVLSLPLPSRGRGSGHSLSSESVSAFSDMCCDMSESPATPILRNSVFTSSVSRESGLLGTSRYQSVSGIPLTASLGDGVTDQDVQQVEMFYRSHKTEVTVCRCLANLYLGSVASKGSSPSIPTPMNGSVSSSKYSDLWEFVTTGIPLLVQDSGDHHRSKQLTIVLAEKGTGFVLWKDFVNAVSHYSCPDSNFHTLKLSTDVKKLVGLSFDDSKAAGEFGSYITQLTAELDEGSGTLTKRGKRKKKQDSKRRVKCKLPKKTDISQPCCFQHITKLERPQVTGVMPLPPNSFQPAHGSSVSGLSEIMRDRLSVSSRTPSYSSDISEACTMASEH